MCMHGGLTSGLGFFLCCSLPYSWGRVSHWNWSSLFQLIWPANLLGCFLSPSASCVLGSQQDCHTHRAFECVLGVWSSPLCSTRWVISPANPQLYFFLNQTIRIPHLYETKKLCGTVTNLLTNWFELVMERTNVFKQWLKGDFHWKDKIYWRIISV